MGSQWIYQRKGFCFRMAQEIPTLIIAILATWRLSAMMSYETGPFDVFTYIRESVGIVHDDTGQKIGVPETFIAKLLDCVWCNSVWIAFVIVIMLYFYPVFVWFVFPFALSTGAIIVEKVTHD